MSAENAAYAEGRRILKELRLLQDEVVGIDASDTQTKERALALLRETREKLGEALTVLAGLV